MNENCSLTVVIVNQVQRAYSISVSLAMMYIKLSLCIERIIIINSVLYKKANASGDVKPVQLWTIKGPVIIYHLGGSEDFGGIT